AEAAAIREAAAAVEVLTDIDATKARSDKKSYRLVRLPNGMRVMLVHEPAGAARDSDEESVGSDSDEYEDDDGSEYEEYTDEGSGDEDGEYNSESDADAPRGGGGGGGGDIVKRAAVAMAVGVGSFSDPPHCQGLAHYLEHMLFMGSKKYPSENEYDTFISKHGGSSNAMTELEYTLYYFDVLPEHLEKAMDIFAQFFIAPLMLPDSSERELQSIESEFSLSVNSDGSRLQQLRCHSARAEHPFSGFSWGNLKSLQDDPQVAGVDVRQELLDFHARYYCAPMMQLVVVGTQSLDELQQMAVERFALVRAAPALPLPVPMANTPAVAAAAVGASDAAAMPPPAPSAAAVEGAVAAVVAVDGDAVVPVAAAGTGGRIGPVLAVDASGPPGSALPPSQALVFERCGLPMAPEQLGRLWRVKPVKDLHRLIAIFQLPPQLQHYHSKPCEYLGHLIGHEGEGSLLSLCKARGLATGIMAGLGDGGYENNTSCALFTVAVSLTKAGVAAWPSVVEALFAYLGMLKQAGTQKWVFDELRDVAAVQFDFEEESEPCELAEDLAVEMLPAGRTREEDLLRAAYLFDDWRPDLIEDVLSRLEPRGVRLELQSSLFGMARDKEAAAAAK
ncbi:unnamed protein product, partial [Phaeothamnion confervicola]